MTRCMVGVAMIFYLVVQATTSFTAVPAKIP